MKLKDEIYFLMMSRFLMERGIRRRSSKKLVSFRLDAYEIKNLVCGTGFPVRISGLYMVGSHLFLILGEDIRRFRRLFSSGGIRLCSTER